jgi:twinkle protein
MTYSEAFMKWWAVRGVTVDVLISEGIRLESKDGLNHMVIPYMSDGVELFSRWIGSNKTEFYTKDPMIMYGKAVSNEVIHIVQDEIERLLLLSAGIKNVMAFPLDMANWKECLDNMKTLIHDAIAVCLAFHKDERGVSHEELISEHIGIHKCFNVIYDEGCVSLLDQFKSGGHKSVVDSIMNAKPVPISNVKDFMDYQQEILNHYAMGEPRGLSTGYDNLDKYWTHQKGSMNIWVGIPSSGKSEFLDGIALNSIRLHDWKWAFYSPENMPAQFHFQKLAEKHVGLPMFGEERMGVGDLKTAMARLSRSIKIITPQENSLDLDQILLKAKVCKMRYRIDAMVIDPYNEVEHTRPNGMSETEYVSLFLGKIRHFSRIHEIETHIVAHPTKMQKDERNVGEYPVPTPYDISGSANFRNKADNCFSVWRKYNNNPDNEVEVHVQKVRNKNIGQIGKAVFNWQRFNGRFKENC